MMRFRAAADQDESRPQSVRLANARRESKTGLSLGSRGTVIQHCDAIDRNSHQLNFGLAFYGVSVLADRG